ncbi:MAG: HRDC domain-containing protein [Aestuariivirgaceae bacterium]|nr:HRDC domain-containing protein [Aestuariivirgaceae bacterium]
MHRQIVAAGFLTVNHELYGALQLTEAAGPVLKGEQTLRLRRDAAAVFKKSSRAGRPAGSAPAALSETDDALWHKLRACRLELAKAQGVPPYVIFHDSTLLEMVRQKPVDMLGLSKISGIGTTKMERYGDAFLAVIRAS